MSERVSLHDLKKGQKKSTENNTIGDGDYFLRDKEEEKKLGYPNSHDFTPKVVKPTRVAKATSEKAV
mgnify:CR=1 FL=1